MEKIKVYNKADIAAMLERFGFAVELFENWHNDSPLSHDHDVLEINYVARGCATQFASGVKGQISAGMVTVINYGLEHSIITDMGSIDIINIYIDIERFRLPQFSEDFISVLRQIIPLHKFSINRLNEVFVITADKPKDFERLLLNVIAEQREQRFGYEPALEQYFGLLLVMLCRFAKISGFSRASIGGSGFDEIEKLTSFLENNCHRHLELSQISEYIGFNKNYLCRKFKAITGQPIFQYLLSRRLDRAMYELRTSDKKVIDIALDCGFSDVSNFNRQFKRAFGKTPSGYRDGL